tara:strand:+ start:428 stop:589 length:162 start_codon:yes stop_codon:yes gene_type:complete
LQSSKERVLILEVAVKFRIAQIARISEQSASRAFANSRTLKPFKILEKILRLN